MPTVSQVEPSKTSTSHSVPDGALSLPKPAKSKYSNVASEPVPGSTSAKSSTGTFDALRPCRVTVVVAPVCAVAESGLKDLFAWVEVLIATTEKSAHALSWTAPVP